MNDKRKLRTASFALLALACIAAAPAVAQEADIERCIELRSDAERLACFDAAAKRRAEPAEPAAPMEAAAPDVVETPPTAEQPAATPAAPAAPVLTEAPAAATGSGTAPAASSAGAAAAAAETADAAGTTANTEYRFMTKEEKKAARRAKKEAEKARREYTAVVVGMRKRPHGQMVVTLDNGEVWSEQYASRGFLVDVGDTVTMRKSSFSSAYRLVNEKGKGYSVTRLE